MNSKENVLQINMMADFEQFRPLCGPKAERELVHECVRYYFREIADTIRPIIRRHVQLNADGLAVTGMILDYAENVPMVYVEVFGNESEWSGNIKQVGDEALESFKRITPWPHAVREFNIGSLLRLRLESFEG